MLAPKLSEDEEITARCNEAHEYLGHIIDKLKSKNTDVKKESQNDIPVNEGPQMPACPCSDEEKEVEGDEVVPKLLQVHKATE